MLLDIFTFESMITCQVSNKVTEQRSSNYGVQKTKRKTASCKIYFFLIIKRNVMYLCTIKLHHANQSFHFKCPCPFISVLQGIDWQIDRDAMTAKQIMTIYRWLHFTIISLHGSTWAWLQHLYTYYPIPMAIHWCSSLDTEKDEQCLVAAAPIGTHGESASETRSDTQPWHAAILCSPSQTMHEQHGPPSLAQRLAA